MRSKPNGVPASAGRRRSARMKSSSRGFSGNLPGPAPKKLSPKRLEALVAEIEEAKLPRLRDLWRTHLQSEPPKLKSREFTASLLAWQLQARVLGGFDRWTEQRLKVLAASLDRDPAYRPHAPLMLKPGLVLTRDWKGVEHRVLVQSDGFLHRGKTYRSLTEVARVITGTRWSGPRFFGVEAGRRRRKREDRS